MHSDKPLGLQPPLTDEQESQQVEEDIFGEQDEPHEEVAMIDEIESRPLDNEGDIRPSVSRTNSPEPRLRREGYFPRIPHPIITLTLRL